MNFVWEGRGPRVEEWPCEGSVVHTSLPVSPTRCPRDSPWVRGVRGTINVPSSSDHDLSKLFREYVPFLDVVTVLVLDRVDD